MIFFADLIICIYLIILYKKFFSMPGIFVAVNGAGDRDQRVGKRNAKK